jgi:hypothetical protein
MEEQCKKGLIMLEKHKQIMQENSFKLLGRMILPLAYEMPARRFFKSFIN